MSDWRELEWPYSFHAWAKATGPYKAVGHMIGVTHKTVWYLANGTMLLTAPVRKELLKRGWEERQLPPPGWRTLRLNRNREHENLGPMEPPPGHEYIIDENSCRMPKAEKHHLELARYFRSKEGGAYDRPDANQLACVVMNHRIYKEAVA